MLRDVCVNPACYRWGTSLREFVEVSRAAGFEHVEVSIQQAESLAEELGGTAALTRWRQRAGVEVAQFSGLLPAGPVLPAPLLVDEPQFRAAVASVHERLEVAQALGCQRAAVVVNPRTHLPPATAAEIAARRLDVLAAAAGEHGVRLAVEYIGVTRGLAPELDGPHPFVASLRELDELLARCGRPNVGILLDLCHLYASGESLGHARACARPVEFVQVSDVPSGTAPATMTDSLRCVPGSGVVDFDAVMRDLDAIGYTGPVSVELFSPELWALEPGRAADVLSRSRSVLR
ncbi:sugar phosphate isomerase/epimerase family protein [Frankia sp. Cr2]|uniref:sugar phosphate isomerase/epimerase family protein n=1 Tax=Frankia sp. Cr2 TaxID=3073932 RepID=UPI002AD2A269|nr:sugar phosphate isomerase/epimerase family protein [Frankia sp. Cr2]